MGGTMKATNKIIKFIAVMMIVAIASGLCGCSVKLPFMKKDTRTVQEYQAEAKELSYYLIRRMLIGDYASIKTYLKSEEKDKVEEIVTSLDSRLYDAADIAIVSVYTDENTHETSISFRITLTFQTSTSSSICQLSMKPSGSSWKIENAVAFCMDIQNINDIYIEGKKQDENFTK